MKIVRSVFYAIGIILILLNVVNGLTILRTPPEDSAERLGYYFGYVLFFIPGILFILWARSITKRMRRKKEQALVDSLPE